MNMRSIAVLCLVVVVASVQVDAIIQKAYEGARKAVQDAGDTVIEKYMDFFCTHGGEFMEEGAKMAKCEDEKADYCKFINNMPMIYQVICGMAKDQKKDAYKNFTNCFSSTNPQQCYHDFYDQYKSLIDAAKMASEQGRR